MLLNKLVVKPISFDRNSKPKDKTLFMNWRQTDEVKKINPLTLIQLILEVSVIVGYVVGVAGSLLLAYYALVAWWLIPVTICIVIIAFSEQTGSEKQNIANFLCALLTLIPLFGFISGILGIILSIWSIIKIYPLLEEMELKTDFSSTKTGLYKKEVKPRIAAAKKIHKLASKEATKKNNTSKEKLEKYKVDSN